MNSERVRYRSHSYFEIDTGQSQDWRDYRSPEYFEYRRLWEDRPARRNPGSFPLHVDIDPTNACNLKCTMCPRTHYLAQGNTAWAPGGRIGFMDFDLFKSVIAQAAAGGAFSIKMNFLGEPLLHPRIVDMVRAASEAGLEVMMNTNATLLTPELSARLLEAGLDDLFFSVDSPYKDRYEAIRVGADFDRVIDNVRGFLEARERLGRRHVQTRVSMVLLDTEDREQVVADYKRLFTDLGVAEIGCGLPSDLTVDYWGAYGEIPGFCCRDLYQRMFVYWDGKIGPCCGHWERALLVGDANKESLAGVWRGPIYHQLREAHESGRYETVGICRACSVPYLSTQEVGA